MPWKRTDPIPRIKAKTIYQGDCWIFTGKLTGRGYGNIWYENKMVRIGRLICHLYHGADLNNPSWVAAHKDRCENKACWNPDHLYVGTYQSNVDDSIRRGTFHYGTNNLNVPGSKHNRVLTGKKYA